MVLLLIYGLYGSLQCAVSLLSHSLVMVPNATDFLASILTYRLSHDSWPLAPSRIWPSLATTRFRRLDRTSNSECCGPLWHVQLAFLYVFSMGCVENTISVVSLLLCLLFNIFSVVPCIHFLRNVFTELLAVAGWLVCCS